MFMQTFAKNEFNTIYHVNTVYYAGTSNQVKANGMNQVKCTQTVHFSTVMMCSPKHTFTATGVPSCNSALCTWAKLAAATGSWSNVLKSLSGVVLKSSWNKAST